jgi:hypothetical protein
MTNEPRIKTLAALAAKAPKVFDVLGTEDMGFECSILTDQGIIFRQPGMLLDFSDGQWPFHDEMTDKQRSEKLAELVLFLEFSITPFSDIDLETLQNIHSEIAEGEISE